MMNDFDEYIRQGEPSRVEKTKNWQTAIGLQQVDGLKPSAYLIETAKQNIEGDITIDEVKDRIDTYYKSLSNRQKDADDRTEEADKVSARITELLSEKTFSFTPLEYISIHRRLFTGIYKFAGKIRDYNITKGEWVLDGETVLYSSASMITEILEYDFKEEKNFEYKGLTNQEQVQHIAKFVSGLWQIHAFGEGNTRTTAVFTIKYLRSFGFKVQNDMFASDSWYFRNALVRANYNDYKNKIYATLNYLMKFFGNLLFDENNELKNRHLHIMYIKPMKADDVSEKPDNVGINVGIKSNILNMIAENEQITVPELAKILNVTTRTIERYIRELQKNNIIRREGARKNGSWKIINSNAKQ